ncbi:MAG: methyltransferase [Antricoccus sp.]
MINELTTWDLNRPDLSVLRARCGRQLRDVLSVRLSAPAEMLPLWRLFSQGDPVPAGSVNKLPTDELVATGLLIRLDGDYVRSTVCVAWNDLPATAGWIASDFEWQDGEENYVGGPGNAAMTLAYARPPLSVGGCAVDLGTGSGALALGLLQHMDEVVVTDVNPRALAFAELTSALAGESWTPLCGDGTAVLETDQAAFISWNPPFVIGNPGRAHIFRDSTVGEGQAQQILTSIGCALPLGGVGQFLANWVYRESDPIEPILAAARAANLDCLVIERAVVPPARYVQLWAGEGADHDAWTAGLKHAGAVAIGLGIITITPATQPRRDQRVIRNYQLELQSLAPIVQAWLT